MYWFLYGNGLRHERVKVPMRLASSLIFSDSISRWKIRDFCIFVSSVTLSNKCVESNMNPRYFISCDSKKIILSRCIRNPMLPVIHSSYVCPYIIRWVMYVAMIPSNLKTTNRGLCEFLWVFVSPFGSTLNFKSLDPAKSWSCFVSFSSTFI